MTTEPPVEPVLRALNLLQALNRKPASTLGDLRAATGLPKPTLVRLLNTLIAAGYAARISPRAGYRITEHVLALSGGLRFIDRIVDAATVPMRTFTRDHGWPLSLGKVRDGAVVVLHSTTTESPLSFEQSGYNRVYQLAVSALGQVYMAFCPAEERRRLLRQLRPGTGVGMEAMADARAIETHLATVRRRGYAVTLSPRPAPVIGLAVPILWGREVPACLVMRFPRSVMTAPEAAERHLSHLNATAASITDGLAAQQMAS